MLCKLNRQSKGHNKFKVVNSIYSLPVVSDNPEIRFKKSFEEITESLGRFLNEKLSIHILKADL